ncbi:hypothetical protein ACFLYY_02550 [Patescibacteria group bacterium]
MEKIPRTLAELKIRSKRVLELEGEVRKIFIQIATDKNPSAVWDLAQANAINHGYDLTEAMELSKATRWLSIIRRDYGEDEFLRVIG